jgi:very-short-patch-repair endonuclease
MPGVPQPAWHISGNPELYIRVIDAIKAAEVLRRANSPFEKTIQILEPIRATKNAHPSIEDLHLSVIDRNENAYSQAYEKLKSLAKLRASTERKSFLTEKLAKLAYPVVERLSSNPDDSEWDERCSHFVKSWRWAQAKTWLNEYIGNLREKELNIELEGVETRIGSITARLAAAKAWHHCMNRMNQKEEQNLKAWAHAIKRVGKGTGKHAERHRREARGHMEHCRSAIPAWIMPLYRVVETVKPGVDLFDVAIIDEASQSGPEALLLFFLAKKIIVVGDPEQISPQSIGVDRNQVVNLRDQYIRNVPNKDAVDPDTSFFTLCDILFSGKIVLREHFRCMPEIIGFSNQLCYTSTPLQPLRQYPRNRLEPIKTVHVSNGYRAGTQTMASNPPEVEAVVAKIKECCKDSSYDGKSMGVISLLGDNQARIIQRKLLDEIGAQEMEKRKLICGDAYAFQGDERDVMFLSMVAAPGETEMRAITADTYKQRFNVAASRARDQVWLFHTPTLNDFRNHECLRYQLLKYYLEPESKAIITEDLNLAQLRRQAEQAWKNNEKPPNPFDSWFEVDVFLKIVDKGYRVIPQFKFAGYFIDLVVEGMGKKLAVECYGDRWHSDPRKREEDMLRVRMLERCKWTVWIVWGSEFYLNQESAMKSLWEKLDFLGIAPGGKDIDFDTSAVTPEPFQLSTADGDSSEGNLFAEEGDASNHLGSQDAGKSATTIQERGRLDFTKRELKEAIESVLNVCPHNTCTRKSLTSRVCKYLGVKTRGNPRKKLEGRVMKTLSELISEGNIEEYKAKNVRIRLIQDEW